VGGRAKGNGTVSLIRGKIMGERGITVILCLWSGPWRWFLEPGDPDVSHHQSR
jgi:hypothetical protein